MIEPVDQAKKADFQPTAQRMFRITTLSATVLLLFGVVFLRLWYLQVLSGPEYLAEANKNRVREVTLQAPRGKIVDRSGRVIVSNRLATVVKIDPRSLPKEERDLAATWGQQVTARLRRPRSQRGAPIQTPEIPLSLQPRFQALGKVLGLSQTAVQKRVIRSLSILPYGQITIKTDVPRPVLNYIAERQREFPGVIVDQVFLRSYPRRDLAAHSLGTVGQVSPQQLRWKRFRHVRKGTIVGQSGIEARYDEYLRGQLGKQRFEVDAFGQPRATLKGTKPQSGRQLRLSLDSRLQAAAQKALTGVGNSGGKPAAFVALDPRNGEVLGLGSYPTFDPTVLTKQLSQEEFDQFFDREDKPSFNRALAGTYPVGSTFKPVTAIAALESKIITPDTVIADAGCITVGIQKFCNAGKAVNGPVALRRALEVSSDVYFYRLGQRANPLPGQVIQTWARRLSLGRCTGIDIPGEFCGLIPDRRWRQKVAAREFRCRKREKKASCGISDGRSWSVGDNIQLAIGQGDVQLTPLQMAVAYSAIVNGGDVVRPHIGLAIEDTQGALIQKIQPKPAQRVNISPEFKQAIMDGLRGVTSAGDGTAYDVFANWPQDKYPVYGKTGTAETARGDQSWFLGYVPDPRKPIVVAATVEQGGFGAQAAAPIVSAILADWFNVKYDVTVGKSTTR